KSGTEFAVALGIANVIVSQGLGAAAGERAALKNALAEWTPDKVAALSDVPAATIARLAQMFTKRSPSLAVAGGIATQGTHGTALVAAVNVLNHVAGNTGRTVRFDRALDVSGLATFAEFTSELAGMTSGKVDVLLVNGANPLYAAPDWAGTRDAFPKVPFKVALSTSRDETTDGCDVILPISHTLESFGDAWTARGVYSLQQPAMKKLPMFDSRPLGDALIALGKAAGGGKSWPDTYHDYLQGRWKALQPRFAKGRDFETFWTESLAAGGVFEDAAATPVSWKSTPAFAASERSGDGDYALLVAPSSNFYDGRGANRPWLQELPDMTSKTVWGSWAEVHPETAAKLGVKQGEALRIETSAGSVEVPAYLYAGIRKDTVAIALGQGHTAYGRYARGRGVNAVRLLPKAMDDAAGAMAYQSTNTRLARGVKAMELYFQQAEKSQHDREIAQIVPISALLGTGAAAELRSGGGAAGAGGKETKPSAGHFAAGPGYEEQDPSMTRPGRSTEPKQHPD